MCVCVCERDIFLNGNIDVGSVKQVLSIDSIFIIAINELSH